jgi:hypothetical protein
MIMVMVTIMIQAASYLILDNHGVGNECCSRTEQLSTVNEQVTISGADNRSGQRYIYYSQIYYQESKILTSVHRTESSPKECTTHLAGLFDTSGGY